MVGRLQTRGAGRRWLTITGSGIVMLLGIWIGGLLLFVSLIPTEIVDSQSETDAIVVLTGGTARLETGFELLEHKRGKKLFVSGVYQGVDVARILEVSRRKPGEFSCCVNLGYAASSTAGNAVETKSWLRRENYRSVRLVTASYHMPRSLFEFRQTMPNVTIVPHAVFPPEFKREQWWAWPGTANLIATEYTKLLIAWLRHLRDGPTRASNAS